MNVTCNYRSRTVIGLEIGSPEKRRQWQCQQRSFRRTDAECFELLSQKKNRVKWSIGGATSKRWTGNGDRTYLVTGVGGRNELTRGIRERGFFQLPMCSRFCESVTPGVSDEKQVLVNACAQRWWNPATTTSREARGFFLSRGVYNTHKPNHSGNSYNSCKSGQSQRNFY